MPTTVVTVLPTAEPVTLAMAVAALRLDVDVDATDAATVGQLDLLQLYLSAAREKVEAYTGRYFAAQTVAITYELGEGYALPAGATATAVSGFFTTLEALADASATLEEYRKGISINRTLPWGDALRQTFTVTATVVPDTQYLNLAKAAMLELTGEWFRNRETTVAGVAVIAELPVSWKVKLAQAVVHPIGGH